MIENWLKIINLIKILKIFINNQSIYYHYIIILWEIKIYNQN